MDKHELETFKIDQMFIGSSKNELIALGEKRREKYPNFCDFQAFGKYLLGDDDDD